MPTVRFSDLAKQDYRDIWDYIAADNPDAADAFLRRIDTTLRMYATNPGMGKSHDRLLKGVRSFPVGNYLVFYRPNAGGIDVVRVIHGARDLSGPS